MAPGAILGLSSQCSLLTAASVIWSTRRGARRHADIAAQRNRAGAGAELLCDLGAYCGVGGAGGVARFNASLMTRPMRS